jgi:hypothetical protein
MMDKEQEAVDVGLPATARWRGAGVCVVVVGMPARMLRRRSRAGRPHGSVADRRWRRENAQWRSCLRRPCVAGIYTPHVLPVMVFYQRGPVPPHTAWAEQSREAATTGALTPRPAYIYLHGDGSELIRYDPSPPGNYS